MNVVDVKSGYPCLKGKIGLDITADMERRRGKKIFELAAHSGRALWVAFPTRFQEYSTPEGIYGGSFSPYLGPFNVQKFVS